MLCSTRAHVDDPRVDVDSPRVDVDKARPDVDPTRVDVDPTRVDVDPTRVDVYDPLQGKCQHACRADLCAARVLYVFDVDYFGEKDQAAACAHVQAHDSYIKISTRILL